MIKRDAIWAGLIGGILFGVVQSFSMGLEGGLFMGIFFGVGLGIAMPLFANSKTIKNQVQADEVDLLPGERVLLTKLANLVVEPKDFGLDSFAFGGLLWMVGMKNKESLGGAIHLTNYRIIFKSHRYNRMRGLTSIFLPTIEKLENRTVLIFRKLAIKTVSAKVELVIADVDDVIAQINAEIDQLDAKTLAEIKLHAVNYPEKCNAGLKPWTGFNKLNSLFNLGKKATDVTQAVVNPLGALGSVFLSELLDNTLTEKWQEVFRCAEQNQAERPAA